MKYAEFKQKVIVELMDYLPNYQGYEVALNKINKVNETLDGIAIVQKNKKKSISPTLYVEEMYDLYQETGNFELVMNKTAKEIERGFTYLKTHTDVNDLPNYGSPDFIKANVVPVLINPKYNLNLLETAPNREWLDLSIIYRVIIQCNEESIQAYTINNDLANEIGISEKELYELGMKNLDRILPVQVIGDFTEDGLVMMTTLARRNGAIYLASIEHLEMIASACETNLHIIPSSIDEIIILKEDEHPPQGLIPIVKKVNDEVLQKNEILSYNVYHYDKDTKEISIIQNELKANYC